MQTAVQFADAHCAVFEPELGEHKLECATSGVASDTDTREVLLQICLYSFCMLFACSCSLLQCRYTRLHNEFKQLFEDAGSFFGSIPPVSLSCLPCSLRARLQAWAALSHGTQWSGQAECLLEQRRCNARGIVDMKPFTAQRLAQLPIQLGRRSTMLLKKSGRKKEASSLLFHPEQAAARWSHECRRGAGTCRNHVHVSAVRLLLPGTRHSVSFV